MFGTDHDNPTMTEGNSTRLANGAVVVLLAGSSPVIGHPFAANGARIVATLAKLLAERDGPGRGLISIRAAGGPGVTAIVERP